MANFTKQNLRDVEDGAKKRGIEGREMHHASAALGLEHSGLSYQKYEPNHENSFGHSHTEQEEIYIVIRGSGQMKLDDEIIDVAEYDAVRVAPSVVRGFRSGPDGLEFIAIGAPHTGKDQFSAEPDLWSK